jgi:hypothetical protein
MINPSKRLAEFEARYLRDAFRDLTYQDALDLFEALWVEARSINPGIGEDWRQDLEPDLAVARAVNGLSAIA